MYPKQFMESVVCNELPTSTFAPTGS